MKVIQATSCAREALDPYVDQILNVLEHPEALVTDESTIAHFLDWRARPHRMKRGKHGKWIEVSADLEAQRENTKRLQKLHEALKVPIEENDYVIDVARRIKALGQA